MIECRVCRCEWEHWRSSEQWSRGECFVPEYPCAQCALAAERRCEDSATPKGHGMTNQDSTMSHSTAEQTVALSVAASVARQNDLEGVALTIELAATRLEHLERALTETREMTCGTEHCMTCGPIRRAIDRALSGNE